MRIFRTFDEARGIKNPVVTTGSFDGVHIGHKTILNRLRLLAEKYNGESVLITFWPHPRKVLYPESSGKDLKLINSQEEKLMLLEKAGLENVIIIEFTREFSRTTSEVFVRDYLHNILRAKVIVAGFNHHFGFNQQGDYRQLWEWKDKYGYETEEIPEQEVFHETVSSTRIRQAISEGYIQRANAYLDHYYLIMGKTESEIPLTQEELVFNRVVISEESKLLPPPGLYAVSAESGKMESKAMVLIYMSNEDRSEVLVHVLSHHIPGSKIKLCFHKRITGAVNLADPGSSFRMLAARDDISELIY